MRLILISAVPNEIKELYRLGVFVGVASNPSLVAQAGVPSEELVRTVLDMVPDPDPVFIQVSGIMADAMIQEGKRLCDRPCSRSGQDPRDSPGARGNLCVGIGRCSNHRDRDLRVQ